MMGNLFNRITVRTYIENVRKNLLKEIDKIEVTESTNVTNIIERLTNRWTIYPIVFDEPSPSSPKETTRKRKNMWNEEYEQKVYEISVTITYDGNKDIFYLTPQTSTVVYLDKNVIINSGRISTTIVLEDLDAGKYQSAINKILGQLKTNLPRIHAELKPWNDNIESFIENALSKRQGVVSKKHDFMQKIGLKVNPSSDKFLVPNPVKKRKIPKPETLKPKPANKEIVPVLKDDVYSDIKEVLFNVGQAIERKPSLYLNKHEEDLRDIFLLFLETRYEATTGVGEAFNKKGKTDILLKYSKDGSNLFVAECKFWKGKKSLLSAIDQLLGYLTHRDSKTALMIFVDQKQLTTVVVTSEEEIKSHPNYSRRVKSFDNTSITYEMTLPQDLGKKIEMELMFFHFPK